jgi:hypothetical protein
VPAARYDGIFNRFGMPAAIFNCFGMLAATYDSIFNHFGRLAAENIVTLCSGDSFFSQTNNAKTFHCS